MCRVGILDPESKLLALDRAPVAAEIFTRRALNILPKKGADSATLVGQPLGGDGPVVFTLVEHMAEAKGWTT